MNRRHTLPSLGRLHCLSQRRQKLVGAYLAHLQARQYAPTTLQTTSDAVNSCCVLLPAPRPPRLRQDLTHSTADDIDAWLHAACHKGLAPSTINHLLSVMPRFFALFKVIDSSRDRAMMLLMLRGGLRVGEVRAFTWPAIDLTAGSIRIDNSKGPVARVVSTSPDVEQVLRPWRRWQPSEATDVFPSPLKHGLPLSVRAIQHRMATYLKRARIAKPYSPHPLRHTFATQLPGFSAKKGVNAW